MTDVEVNMSNRIVHRHGPLVMVSSYVHHMYEHSDKHEGRF